MGEKADGTLQTADFIKVRAPSGSDDIHYSAFYEGIPEEFLVKAQKTLNETEENKHNGMKTLRAFVKRKDLRCTDEDLLFVLRICKYNLKKAEKKLKNYLKLRQKVQNLVSNMDDSKTDLILDEIIVGVLPYRDKYGRIVIASRPNIHLDLYEPDEVDPLALALVFYVATLPLTAVAGLSWLAECKTENIYLFYPIIKQFRKSYLNFVLDLPMRLGRVDFVNENFLVRWCYNIIRPILPEKVSKRLNFHGSDYKTLASHYNPEILPEEFGGNLGPLNDKHFRQRLLNFIQNLKDENKMMGNNNKQ